MVKDNTHIGLLKKSLSRLEIHENFLHLLNSIYQKLRANFILNDESLKSLPFEKKQDRCHHYFHLTFYWMSNEKIKRHTDWKERNKTVTIHRDDILLCTRIQEDLWVSYLKYESSLILEI